MSRVGKKPISLRKGVEVKVTGNKVLVKGPKGSLEQEFLEGIALEVEGEEIKLSVKGEKKELMPFLGLYRSLVSNMVVGVSEGFEKRLELIGVGFRAAVQGSLLDLQLGFSHPLKLGIPEGIAVQVEKSTKIVISGTDKQKVGQFAADIRSKRPPEPYKGKGVRYVGEYVRKKAGKAGKAGK